MPCPYFLLIGILRAGMPIANSVPFLGDEKHSRLPRCFFVTISWQIGSPNPVPLPSILVVNSWAQKIIIPILT